MSVLAWAATVLALITLWALSWTANGLASVVLVALFVVFAGVAFWAFGGHRSGARR